MKLESPRFFRRAALAVTSGVMLMGLARSAASQGFKVIHNCSSIDEFPSTPIQAPLPDGNFYGTSLGGGTGFGSVLR
jgi:hypothetical protein